MAPPSEFVGDICLSPILRLGDAAMLGNPLSKQVAMVLKPQPNYTTLHKLAEEDKTIYIATGFEHDDICRDQKNIPRFIHSKLTITRAILFLVRSPKRACSARPSPMT